MKVLFVHNGPVFQTPDGSLYGVTHNNDLVRRYHYLGSQVTFLMRKKNIESAASKFSKIDVDGFSFIEIPEIMSLKTRIKNYRQACSIIKEAIQNHDIVIIRLPSAVGNIAVKLCKQEEKPFIVEMVACSWDVLWNYNWKTKFIAPYFFLRLRNRIKKLPYVIYVTNNFLQKRYPSKGIQTNISNVELTYIDESNKKKRINKITDWNKSSPLILGTIAALDVPYKGQADVIKALAKMGVAKQKFIYRLIGQGDDNKLQLLIEKLKLHSQVQILGPIPHNKIFSFLDNIDIYIQPSKQEGLPRALIEAMSRACPAIGARTGGIPELLSEDRIFDKGSINQIIDQIINLSNKENMIKSAICNFNEAKKYEKKVLEEGRNKYYYNFLKDHNLLAKTSKQK